MRAFVAAILIGPRLYRGLRGTPTSARSSTLVPRGRCGFQADYPGEDSFDSRQWVSLFLWLRMSCPS